jgi:transcriptional regulator with XRE-family HTH domain
MTRRERDGMRRAAVPQRRVPEGVDPRRVGSALSANDADAAGTIQIGRTIREVRTQQGLSAKALAAAAGVTPAMISQVEKGSASPSIATLLRIAGALNVSVGDLFNQHPPLGRVMRVADRVLLDYPDSGVRDEIISADPTGNLQVFWCELEPGAGSGDEPLEHGSEMEFALVLEGRAVISIGTEKVTLERGDTVTFSGRAPHGYRNDIDGRTILLWVTTPASF